MAHMGRPGLSAAQKAELWQRWKQGQSLSEIGRALGKHAGSIHGVLSSNGGFIPPVRKRSRWALTLAEREEISRGLAMARSIRQIATTLGRAPSTVSREIHRHGGAPTYRAAEADTQAWARTRRPKPCRLATSPLLQQIVASKLALEWSPDKSRDGSSWNFPDQDTMRISHETIYRSLFIQARGVLKKELLGHLRSRRKMRRVKHASTAGQPRGQIVDGLSIRDRPAERGRSGDSRSLGRGSDHGLTEYAHRHLGGTAVTLHDAGEGAGERHRQCGDGAEQADPATALNLASVVNLGSRNGIGPAQTLDDRYQGAGLFL